MSNWRDAILNEFVPHVSKLTLVADPDSLLTEEKLALALRERGFDLIEFNDPVEFRYAYESNYRSVWDRGEHTDLVVILRLKNADLESLPYDLLRTGRKLSFDLGDLFPNLSYPVIEKIDHSLLDALYSAQQKSAPERIGDNATKDFILRSVYGIAPDQIESDVELLSVLLRLHYGRSRMPSVLSERLLQVLQGCERLAVWPLREIVSDEEAFFEFLQERWPVFLSQLDKTEHTPGDSTGQLLWALGRAASKKYIRDGQHAYNFQYPGPALLPFDHQDIRIYIDNLFLEGKLKPVQADYIEVAPESWIQSGIASARTKDNDIRITRLFEVLKKEYPAAESRYTDWIAFALKWAELSSMIHCRSDNTCQSRFDHLCDALNTAFTKWVKSHYAGLINLPPSTPAMLHHVPRRLARDLESSHDSRVALIVVDGLSLDQWITIRKILQMQGKNLILRESAIFAWIPTLTSVSRQTVFSGKPPLYFPSSIHSTQSEEKLWKQFWEGFGISRSDVVYRRGLGDCKAAEVLEDVIHPGKTRVVGLIVDKVDKIMHGMQLGAAGMHNQIRQWCEGGFLRELIEDLLDYGYDVWMTSDHGNIECNGRGRPSEGVIAETRGERVRVYPTRELRSQVAEDFPFAHQWPPTGLPPDYFPLVTQGRDAFVNPGSTIVGHGGIAIEEVIVPLIQFERRTR